MSFFPLTERSIYRDLRATLHRCFILFLPPEFVLPFFSGFLFMNCIIPSLIWPSAGVAETLKTIPLPGFSTLLARAKITYLPLQSFETWLAEQFNLSEGSAALALLRLTGEQDFLGESPACVEQGNWLCADPVSLMLSAQHVLLSGPDSLGITQKEAQAVVEALNQNFSDLGRFYAATPTRWYLQTKVEIGVFFHPVSDVTGRPIALFQPEGENQRFWSQIVNELQVFCHNHPVNIERQEAGKPLINGLWLWGAGALDSGRTPKLPQENLRVASIQPAMPLVSGIVQLSGTELFLIGDKPAEYDWVFATSLVEPALQRDARHWLIGLRQIEALVLQPLYQALRARQINHLRIIAPGDSAFAILDISPPSRWQLKQKSASLEQILNFLAPLEK